MYEIARKHCGSSPKWQISLTNLQNKTGSNAPIKRFRHNLREIIKADVTPFYRFEIDEADLVTVRPRSAQVALSPTITIPEWAEEQARAALHIRPQTLRAALCRDGHYFGIRPLKLPNRMLAWPAEGIERLLSGEESAS